MARQYVNTCSDCGKEWLTKEVAKSSRCRPCAGVEKWKRPGYREAYAQKPNPRPIVLCSACGSEKPRGKHTRVFHSTFCRPCAARAMWAKKRKPPLSCETCGKAFPDPCRRSKSRYCSNTCRRFRVTKRCPKCGVEFSVPRSNANRYTHCSIACAYEPSVTRNCETCGDSFRLVASEAKVRGRFCSFKCYRRFTGESSIERATRELIQSAGLTVQREFHVGGKDVFDFYVPSINTLIECDGTYWHSSAEVKARDAAKEARAIAVGYRVVRLSEEVIKSADFHAHLANILAVSVQHPQLRLWSYT